MFNTQVSPQALGYAGERYALTHYQQNGFKVEHQPDGYHFDLLLTCPVKKTTIKIEVKTARKASDGRWHYTLYKKNHADHVTSDYVLLLQISPCGSVTTYLIPTDVLLAKKQVSMSASENYTGIYSQYKNTITPELI